MPDPTTLELNLDGIVGPTHHYAGLARGNRASQQHRHQISQPRQAALEGLDKMTICRRLGLAQAVMPPHDRPDVTMLRRVGFTGSDARVIESASREAPELLAAAASASAMWAANAATVSPAPDTADGRAHLTPANLVAHLHRAGETAFAGRLLRTIFPDDRHFHHHDPLPAAAQLGDEGAANHTRLAPAHGKPGIELFVHGQSTHEPSTTPHQRPRHTLEASRAVARLHQLDPARCVFLRQNPAAIDAGVFHNDVIAVGNENVLLYHGEAYLAGDDAPGRILGAWRTVTDQPLHMIEVPSWELPLEEAVASYLFNSQLVTLPGGGMALIAPKEAEDMDRPRAVLRRLLEQDNPIQQVVFADVRQSMRNGGGPACLRLRVILTADQRAAMHPGVIIDDDKDHALRDWVRTHYREQLTLDDLRDPNLQRESRTALDHLTRILDLGSIYDFQR